MATHTCGHTNSILTFAAFAAQKNDLRPPADPFRGCAVDLESAKSGVGMRHSRTLRVWDLRSSPPGFNAKILTAGQRFQLEGCCWEQQNLEPQIAKGKQELPREIAGRLIPHEFANIPPG